MRNKAIKMVAIILLAILAIATLSQGVFAVDPSKIVANTSGTAATEINGVVGTVLGIVQIVGTGVAVIMLIVLAIKYISAAPGDKADIKKHAVVYVVGAVVLFAASGILGIVKNFVTDAGLGASASGSN